MKLGSSAKVCPDKGWKAENVEAATVVRVLEMTPLLEFP